VLSGVATIPILSSLDWPNRGSNSLSSALEASTLTITPLMRRKTNMTKGQTMVYTILYRKIKIEQHEPYLKPGMNSGRVCSSCSSSDIRRVASVTNYGDKSWMKKGPVSASNKWNISVVIEAHVWIIPRRIQEQVSEKSSPVCTNMYTDCLEKHPPNITIRCQCLKLEHFDDISFREMFGRISVLLVFLK
jgi:hypothetical protein